MSVHHDDGRVVLHHGNALEVARDLETGSVQTIVTSPPYYGLRDYGHPDQMGGESSLAEYVEHLVDLFRELRRVLADDGTVWLNLGDTYAGRANAGPRYSVNHNGIRREGHTAPRQNSIGDAPYKNLLGVPWRVALALQDDGWILRADIVWAKPNPMPQSVNDRPTSAHEYVFLLAKSPRYYYDAVAIATPGSGRASGNGFERPEQIKLGGVGQSEQWDGTDGKLVNRRDVWTIANVGFPGAHFAVYPPELVRPCILAGSREGDVVLDPFSGSGTTGMVALAHGRRYVGIDVNADYLDLSLRTRFAQQPLDLGSLS